LRGAYGPGKRQHYRLAVEAPVAFKIIRGKNLHERNPHFSGMLKDISLGGLQFGTDTLSHDNVYIFNEFEKARDPAFQAQSFIDEVYSSGTRRTLCFIAKPVWSHPGRFG
jgi:hypothetical protein